MSKSSSNNNDINIAYLEKLTESVTDASLVLQKISDSYGANGQLEQTLKGLAKAVNDGNMSTKQMLKQAAATQKNIRSVEYGMEDTARYTKTVSMFTKLLEEKLGNSKIDDALIKKITTAFENLDVTAILESEKIGARGGKGAPLKNVMDNEKLNKVNDDLVKKLGLKLDSVQYKLISFFEGAQQKTTKVIKQLGVDMLEGLEKSKWVGGALRDTFRLVGLLWANFLSQFGQFGRILGGAFYVAMETAGPLLVKLLLQGLGKLFLNLPKMLGNLGKGLWKVALNASTKAGGPLADFATAAKGQRLAAAGRLLGAGAAAAALGTGAFFAGRESYRSFKEGDKVGGGAFGIGALGLGVAAIAAVVAGIAAPVTLIAAAIGGIAVAVGAIWKNREAIVEHYKKNKEFYDKVITWMDKIFPAFFIIRKTTEWILDLIKKLPGMGGDKDKDKDKRRNEGLGGNSSVKAGPIDDMIDNKEGNFKRYGKMKVSKRDGSILNLNELTQDEASEALQMYEKADPTSFNRVYEWVEGDRANLDSHSTDAVKKVDGVKVAALSKKGTSKEIDDLRSQLVGLSPQQIAEFKQTSGKLTGSNKFHGNGGWKSHNNQYALGIDLAGGESWTGEDYKNNLPVIRKYYEALGYDVELEKPGQGKSTGYHYDIKPKKDYRPEGARENFDDYQKVKVTENATKRMSISEVVKTLSEDERKAYAEELKKAKPKNLQDLTNTEEKILNKMGIYAKEDLSGKPWVRVDKNGSETLLKDASGNYLFSELQKIANVGAN